MDLNQSIENVHPIGLIKPTKMIPTLTEHTSSKSTQQFNSRIIQNFILVWLDSTNANEFCQSIMELRSIVNNINTFTSVDQCIDFLTDIKDEKILMIISDELCRNLMPLIHSIIQINFIYIFCKKKIRTSTMDETMGKSESFVSRNSENLDQLDPTYMYTQLLKEIFLTINFNEEHIKDFVNYYRKNFTDNAIQLNNIDKFEENYRNHLPIWWYSHDCSLYSILNRALRMMEIDTIIKMGFFIRDLHDQISKLYKRQIYEDDQMKLFVTYRGQGLSKIDFEKMLKIQGGLISFNNFLSTSKDIHVALSFACSSLVNRTLVGIIFIMRIDPSIKSTSFASINHVSYYNTEQEILFSMHTVFRIGNIIQNNDNNRLWQVDLIQTNDNDQDLNALTQRIRYEIRGSNGWDKLGNLLIKLGQFNKAEELYQVLVNQTHDDREKSHFYHQLGWSKKNQKEYRKAIEFYEKSLEIRQKTLPITNHPSLSITYNDIGSVYEKMGEYSRALLYHEKGLEIQQETVPLDHSNLASSYSKIGCVYEKMGEYSKSLSFHENAIEIRQNMLKSKNTNLAYSYNNIGSVYEKMGQYEKALQSHNEALDIQKEILPSNHPDLAQSYSHIGFVYGKLNQYSKSLQFHQYAIDIGQVSLPFDHPRLQQWKKNLEFIKKKI